MALWRKMNYMTVHFVLITLIEKLCTPRHFRKQMTLNEQSRQNKTKKERNESELFTFSIFFSTNDLIISESFDHIISVSSFSARNQNVDTFTETPGHTDGIFGASFRLNNKHFYKSGKILQL